MNDSSDFNIISRLSGPAVLLDFCKHHKVEVEVSASGEHECHIDTKGPYGSADNALTALVNGIENYLGMVEPDGRKSQ